MARILSGAVVVLLLGGIVPCLVKASCDGAERELSTISALVEQGRFQAVMERHAALAASHPDCVQVVLLSAQAHASRGEFQEAEQAFLRACELAPSDADPHFQLAVMYSNRQQHARAAEKFRKVLSLTPNDPQAYDYLGLSLEKLGEFGKAEAAYRMGLARNSGPRFDPMLHYNYGRYLLMHSRLSEARDQLDRAISLVPTVRAVHYERAKLAERLGDLDGARKHAEESLRLPDPGEVILEMQVHYLLSRIYRALGESELAAKFTALSQQGEIPMRARRR